MSEYNKLQMYYIKVFAHRMHIDNVDKAALEWVRLGLAIKFSEVYRTKLNK